MEQKKGTNRHTKTRVRLPTKISVDTVEDVPRFGQPPVVENVDKINMEMIETDRHSKHSKLFSEASDR